MPFGSGTFSGVVTSMSWAHPVLPYAGSSWGRCPQTPEIYRFAPMAWQGKEDNSTGEHDMNPQRCPPVDRAGPTAAARRGQGGSARIMLLAQSGKSPLHARCGRARTRAGSIGGTRSVIEGRLFGTGRGESIAPQPGAAGLQLDPFTVRGFRGHLTYLGFELGMAAPDFTWQAFSPHRAVSKERECSRAETQGRRAGKRICLVPLCASASLRELLSWVAAGGRARLATTCLTRCSEMVSQRVCEKPTRTRGRGWHRQGRRPWRWSYAGSIPPSPSSSENRLDGE